MYYAEGLHPKDTLNAQHLLGYPWESLIYKFTMVFGLISYWQHFFKRPLS